MYRSLYMNTPTITVIIPTYNYGKFICEAIESILTQDYPSDKIEIIVVDDGSTDKTNVILQPYIDAGQLKYFFQQNKGKASATDFAIKKSTGKYIFNLDADDYFLPNKISDCVNLFEADQQLVHVASPAKIIYHNDKHKASEIEIVPPDITEKSMDGEWLLKRFYNKNILFGGGTTYAARSSVLKTIHIPSSVDMYIDEFLILAILPFGKSYFKSNPLSIWRVHNSNYSVNPSVEKQKLNFERLLRSSEGILLYLKQNDFSKRIVKIYELKHLTRKIAYKELLRTKNTIDIFQYASTVFFKIKPDWSLIRNYHVLNRLVPTRIFRFVKYLGRTAP